MINSFIDLFMRNVTYFVCTIRHSGICEQKRNTFKGQVDFTPKEKDSFSNHVFALNKKLAAQKIGSMRTCTN